MTNNKTTRSRTDTSKFISHSASDTQKLAAQIARRAKEGDVICLIGPLGSGKTTFVRGFVRARGYKGHVSSPSFGIAREYRTGRNVIYHLDLFRVDKNQLPNLDLEEYLGNSRAISLIEWPDVAGAMLPGNRLEIRFSHLSNGARALESQSRGSRR